MLDKLSYETRPVNLTDMNRSKRRSRRAKMTSLGLGAASALLIVSGATPLALGAAGAAALCSIKGRRVKAQIDDAHLERVLETVERFNEEYPQYSFQVMFLRSRRRRHAHRQRAGRVWIRVLERETAVDAPAPRMGSALPSPASQVPSGGAAATPVMAPVHEEEPQRVHDANLLYPAFDEAHESPYA